MVQSFEMWKNNYKKNIFWSMIYGLPVAMMYSLALPIINLNSNETLLSLKMLFILSILGTLIMILFINGIISLKNNISFSFNRSTLIKISLVWYFSFNFSLLVNFEASNGFKKLEKLFMRQHYTIICLKDAECYKQYNKSPFYDRDSLVEKYSQN